MKAIDAHAHLATQYGIGSMEKLNKAIENYYGYKTKILTEEEMAAILLHKGNVYQELSGWSPKYFPPILKKEINGRLQDKFMFGSDYPIISHKRLFQDWDSENYN